MVMPEGVVASVERRPYVQVQAHVRAVRPDDDRVASVRVDEVLRMVSMLEVRSHVVSMVTRRAVPVPLPGEAGVSLAMAMMSLVPRVPAGPEGEHARERARGQEVKHEEHLLSSLPPRSLTRAARARFEPRAPARGALAT